MKIIVLIKIIRTLQEKLNHTQMFIQTYVKQQQN